MPGLVPMATPAGMQVTMVAVPGAAPGMAAPMVSGPDGQWSFFLPPSTPVHYTIFDPVSGLVAEAWDTTAPSGKTTRLSRAR